MEDSQESTLNWLLDMDMSEPEERLFSLDQEAEPETQLSDYELEVARRPMTRGADGADNLENYVDEEIVISSDSQGGDIYSNESRDMSVTEGVDGLARDEQMAIDYSRPSGVADIGGDQTVNEGTDILGLADDDEMGEKFLVGKRVRATGKTVHNPPTAEIETSETATQSPEQPPVTQASENEMPESVINEAPAIRLVNSGEPLSVANDALALEIDELALEELSFDDGHLNPEHIQASAQDSDELTLLPMDAAPYFDTAPAEPIDYHEDFRELAGFGGDTVANVTPLIPRLMEEMSAAVNERVAALQLAPGSVQAELMLGADAADADRLLDDGFEPANAICNPPLTSMHELCQVDADAIFIRLTQSDTGHLCNRLFGEDFTPLAAVEVAELEDTLLAQSQTLVGSEPPVAETEYELGTLLEQSQTLLGSEPPVAEAEYELDTLVAQSQTLLGSEPPVAEAEYELDTLVAQSRALAAADAENLEDSGQDTLADQSQALAAPESSAPTCDDELDTLLGEIQALSPAEADDFSDLEFDTLAAESQAEATADKWQPDDQDINDIFADFGQPETDAAAEEMLTCVQPDKEHEQQLAEGFDVFADDIFSEDITAGLEQGDVEEISVEETRVAGTRVEETELVEFGLEAPGLEHQVDVDTLFDNLDAELQQFEESAAAEAEEIAVSSESVQDTVQREQTPVPALSEDETIASQTAEIICVPLDISFAQASPGGGEIFADFLDAFVEEGSSELEKLEDAVAAWERDSTSEEAYTTVTRILHTVKGIAKGVGLQFYGTLIHNFETLLAGIARPQTGAESDYFRVVNTWLDACVRGLDHIQDSRADIPNVLPQSPGQLDVEPVLPEAPAAIQDAPAPGVPAQQASSQDEPTERQDVPLAAAPYRLADERAKQLSKKIADDGARVLAAQQSVRITSEKLDDLLKLSNQAQQLSVRTAQSVTRGKRTSNEMQSRLASVRAHIAGIADRALRSVAAGGEQSGGPMDALEMDQYSELQEAANILREGVEDLADLVDFATRQNTQVEALLKQQTNVISSIGSAIRGARVVPVSRLLPGLRRLVRTVSVDLNKTVSLRVLNELGTLDRDDYARCQTILDHMMRNALDHGIESVEERIAAGKPEEGQVTIDIRKAGADSIITLADDGRGIDPAKMRESAGRKGLDVDINALTDDEAVRLVFHKGFSTAGAISQISGRGVGMDIVLSELQEMGGDIQIDSVPGRGTSFHIRVPSSVTVNGALLVSAGEQSYAIPLGGLIAVDQVPVDEFFTAVRDNTPLSLAGLECEPAYLATLCHNGHSLDAKTWRNNVPVIIAGSPERYMAIAIDDVEEALELVIRSLGTQFSSVPGVAGAATTAAGEAIVALDLNLLVESVGLGDQSTLEVESQRDEAPLVMVVDDSRTQRMVATSQLETLGVETITAENGAVAIDLLSTADRLPDIILMDVEMPVKDGIQALRDIRNSARFGDVPVIMITSRTGLKHRAMAQAAGCNGYMGKPFNFRMLVGQINELTGHRLQLS